MALTVSERITAAMQHAASGTDKALVEATLQGLYDTDIASAFTAETPSRIAIEDALVELAVSAANILKTGDATNGSVDSTNTAKRNAAMLHATSGSDKTALLTALLGVVNTGGIGLDVLIGGAREYPAFKDQYWAFCGLIANYIREGDKT